MMTVELLTSPVDSWIENDSQVELLLEKFRSVIKGIEGLYTPLDDVFLLRFLRARKFNLSESVKLLRIYYEMLRGNADLQSLTFSAIKGIYEKGILTILKKRDSLGRKILYIQTRNWDPKEVNMIQMLKASFFVVEEMTMCEETQKNGMIMIFDHAGMTYEQTRRIAAQVSLTQIKRLLPIFQGGFPARYKAFHITNAPLIIQFVYTLAKPFLKEKVRKRIHVHGSDLTSLHKFLSPDILPATLKGNMTLAEAQDWDIIQTMLCKENYYNEWNNFGFFRQRNFTPYNREL